MGGGVGGGGERRGRGVETRGGRRKVREVGMKVEEREWGEWERAEGLGGEGGGRKEAAGVGPSLIPSVHCESKFGSSLTPKAEKGRNRPKARPQKERSAGYQTGSAPSGQRMVEAGGESDGRV